MKRTIVGLLLGAGLVLAPTASAETGINPTIDFRCINPAYLHGSHVQGGTKILHKTQCADTIAPADYGSGPELP
jgi:hypothetical protein